MNQIDIFVHEWGWWNKVYTRLLIRSRGYRLSSMVKTLPVVKTVAELSQQKNGALMWLKPRPSSDTSSCRRWRSANMRITWSIFISGKLPRDRIVPFIAYFKKPRLYGRQFSILDTEQRAFEECFTRVRRWREAVPKPKMRPVLKKVPGTYLLAGAEFHNHYAHLFCDVLPRWKLFEEAGLAGQAPALLPPPSHGFVEEAWRKLGFPGHGSQQWDDGWWEMDGLYFASPFKKFCSWTPEAANWIRSSLVPGLDQAPPGQKIFYISRARGPRTILNEQEILRGLESRGVIVVQTEKMTLQQQMDLFSDAAMIMGPHGAGIQNALWAPRGCRVLELVNARYFSGIYWTLAASLNGPYGLVVGASAVGKDALQQGYVCDLKLVLEAFDRLMKLSS